ncbi:MAG: response regulator [Gammaproteobacteria bacterium]|nr:response regulator [Gammaproteobacteria bacterium]
MHIHEIATVLVEPSVAQRRIIESFLKEVGIVDVSWAKTGNEALDTINKILPDLVISAMHLADMTGTDLVQIMRDNETLSEIPFMLISSETHYRYLEPIRQAGVIAILPKPFEANQLMKAIESTVHYLDPGELDTRHFASEEIKVLVVDDSPTARKHIKRVLTNMGIENLTEAENGCHALALVEDNFFDLIVTDYNMPQMDGKELIEHVRNASAQASVPILMVSSEHDDSRLAAVQQAGVSAICDKPFESDVVKKLIERIL